MIPTSVILTVCHKLRRKFFAHRHKDECRSDIMREWFTKEDSRLLSREYFYFYCFIRWHSRWI